MKFTPAIRAALARVDAANAKFFAVLDREARRRPSLAEKEIERRAQASPQRKARRGSLKRAAHPLRAMAGRGGSTR
jgi:hypothetical protein